MIFESCANIFEYFLILLTYQFIDDAEKGNSAFCLAKSLGAAAQFRVSEVRVVQN